MELSAAGVDGMALDRRSFLKRGLLAAGAAAVGVAAGSKLNAGSEQEAAAGATSGTGPAVPILTTEHRVVHLPVSGNMRDGMEMLPAADKTGRQGVSGRKWIMVIDLAA